MADNMNKSNEQINRSIGQRLDAGERDIARKFAHTLNEVYTGLGDIYARFEKDGVVTFAEMAKFDRFNKFMQHIDFLMRSNYKHISKVMYDVLGWSYEMAYNLTAWAIETTAKVKMGWTTATADAVKLAIDNPVSGMVLNDRLEMHRKQIVWKIQQEMTQGLVHGSTYKQMADRIKPALDGDATKAVRVMRTEGHRITEEGKHNAATFANDNGVTMTKEWVNMHDARVRNTPKANHRSGGPLAGKIIPVDELFVGVSGRGPAPGQMGAAAENINCRCILAFDIAGVARKQYNDIETVTFDKWRQMRQP